jgi:hypothetical protein
MFTAGILIASEAVSPFCTTAMSSGQSDFIARMSDCVFREADLHHLLVELVVQVQPFWKIIPLQYYPV